MYLVRIGTKVAWYKSDEPHMDAWRSVADHIGVNMQSVSIYGGNYRIAVKDYADYEFMTLEELKEWANSSDNVERHNEIAEELKEVMKEFTKLSERKALLEEALKGWIEL